MMTRRLAIGVDTGGTYTDAVLMDLANRKVVAKAKSLTTKGDLSIGIAEAMSKVLQHAGPANESSSVTSVSISTTLATNAVVEGHGDPVAIVLIGFDDVMVAKSGIAATLPDVKILTVAGGHDHNGDELQALDVAALRILVATVAPDVKAFAVAARFAVRNSAHEILARELIESTTAKPVTLSCELSESLDAPRRAVTSALNARLISRITLLVASVSRAMERLGLDCPVMIVRGDGSLAKAEAVALRPIETVLSGPAASVIGAKWISGCDSFVMSDIGGTTTDIAVVENGKPHLAPLGAEVGRWRTMVRALDIRTAGLGGDSEVIVGTAGEIAAGSQRALPISLLGSRYPSLEKLLEADLSETTGGSTLGRFVCLPFGATAPTLDGVNDKESLILSQISNVPLPLRKIAVSAAAQRSLASLRKKGLVQVASFTPSDAAHVLGLQDNWSARCAHLAAQLICRFRDMRVPDEARLLAFCHEVHAAVVGQSAQLILQSLLPDGEAESAICRRFTSGHANTPLVNVSIAPNLPIVAVGGPAAVYYPDVGQRLQAKVILTDGGEVANAIGAAAGQIAHRASIRIEGNGSGVFKIFGGQDVRTALSGENALAIAHEMAGQKASLIASQFGAKAPKLSYEIAKAYLPNGTDEDALITATVVATAAADVG